MFPDIRSFSPVYNMGSYAVDSYDQTDIIRYLRSDESRSRELSIPLVPVTTASKGLVEAHYHEHSMGRYFKLPASMFCFFSGGNLVLPQGLYFRYANPLQAQRVSDGFWSVTVSLVSY
jgi:hypothetical protein